MRDRLLRFLGIFFITFGLVMILNNFSGITGFVVSESISLDTGYFLGAVFFVFGILLLDIGNSQASSGLEVLISNKALERSRKDKTISGNIKAYGKEINMIVQDPRIRPQEKIGEFNVSPRGHKNIRVAWHYDSASGKLYIDDLLYHKNDHDYVDNWNKKAVNGDITRKYYEKSGYSSETI